MISHPFAFTEAPAHVMFLFETEHRRLRLSAYENKTNLPEFTVIHETPLVWSLLPTGQSMYEVREDKNSARGVDADSLFRRLSRTARTRRFRAPEYVARRALELNMMFVVVQVNLVLLVLQCFRFSVRMQFQPTVLSSRTQSWSSSYGVNLFSTPFDAESTCSDAQRRGGPREERFRLNASHGTRSQRGFHRSLNLDVCSDSQKTRKKRLVALILTSLSTHSLGKNLDYAAALVCGSMHACSHLCAGMESRWCARSEGEHLAHRTESLEQQSGRRRRHSSRRSCEGNGSDVCSVVVWSMRCLLQRMSLCRVV